jgi:uncharacterized damage-inducible protein DinB
MKRKTTQLFCALFMIALFTTSIFAQADAKKPAEDNRAPIVKETESAWKRAKKWTLEYIDAMPDNALNFKPTPEVRSFAEQMLHLAFWNFGLLEGAGGKANPYGKKQEDLEKRDDMKTKAALRKVVAESYDVVLAEMAGMSEAKMIEQTTFFGRKFTRLSVFSIALDHQTHHRGQTTLYLRLKGVTPPPES